MANHQVPNDPMAKNVLYGMIALLVLTVLILLNFLFNTIDKNSTKGEISTDGQAENTKAIANHIASSAKNQLNPVGIVKTGKKVAGGGTGIRGGEEVYQAICLACHDSGAAGAPIKGDKAAWDPRIATGLESLTASVINGKGAMPARAGNKDLKDEEVHNAIIYLAAQVDADLGKELTGEEKTEGAEADSGETKADEAQTDDKAATETGTAEQATPEAAKAPESPAQQTAPEKPQVQAALEKPAAPSKAPAPKTPVVQAAPEKPASPAAEQKASNSAGIDLATFEKGKGVYSKACFICHDTGAGNSPKLTDEANWKPRIAQGKATLYESAIKGKVGTGVMPPKGGQMQLTDEEVKASVDYMVHQASGAEPPSAAAPVAPKTETAPKTPKTEATPTAPKTEPAPTAPKTEAAPAAPKTAVAPAAPKTAVAPAAPKTAVAPAAPQGAFNTAPTPAKTLARGEQVYNTTCFTCHARGSAGATKLSDKAAWKPLLAKGRTTLYNSSINGVTNTKGVMPAKGGNVYLSDDDVKAAVDYMISQVQ